MADRPTMADLIAVLTFYASGQHFDRSFPDAWRTMIGASQNWWCDEAVTATVEDGSIAKMVLAGELTAEQIDDLGNGGAP